MRTIVDLETLNNLRDAIIIITPKGYNGIFNYLDHLYNKCPLEIVKVSSEFPDLVDAIYQDECNSPVIIWKIDNHVLSVSEHISLKSIKSITKDYYHKFLKKNHN
jgi:hypothetical protein